MGNSFETTPAESPVVGAYCDRANIEMIYGTTNVRKWADIENNGEEDHIEDRIDWACQTATTRMNDRLREGTYPVPFESPYPEQVIEMTARLAGVLLYDSRGITDMGADDEPAHQLSPHRKMVNDFIRLILSKRITFEGLISATNYPRALSLDP